MIGAAADRSAAADDDASNIRGAPESWGSWEQEEERLNNESRLAARAESRASSSGHNEVSHRADEAGGSTDGAVERNAGDAAVEEVIPQNVFGRAGFGWYRVAALKMEDQPRSDTKRWVAFIPMCSYDEDPWTIDARRWGAPTWDPPFHIAPHLIRTAYEYDLEYRRLHENDDGAQ